MLVSFMSMLVHVLENMVAPKTKDGKKKLFFSTDTSLSGEEVLLYYRTRFQTELFFS